MTDKTMTRQAQQIRTMFESATPTAPLTISRALYEKLPPHKRGAYRPDR